MTGPRGGSLTWFGSLAIALTLAAAAFAATAPSPVPLPGGAGGIGFDDLVFSRELGRVLVPAGRTGRLDLVDPATRSIEAVDGFTRKSARTRGHGDGTTSADAGGGYIFAIDRGDRTLVVVEPGARRIIARAKLAGGPDYVRWVEPTHEVWVTEPEREQLEIFRFDAGTSPTLSASASIPVPSGPESLVVDSVHGRAYTNTFGDMTVAVEVRSRKVAARWSNGCRGARGIALDPRRQWVFVGCAEGKVVALDAAGGGNIVGAASTGAGVDGIAFEPARAHLYVPGGDAATLTFVGVGARGLDPLGTAPTARDAHCAAADDRSNVWVCDPQAGRLLVVADPYPPTR